MFVKIRIVQYEYMKKKKLNDNGLIVHSSVTIEKNVEV